MTDEARSAELAERLAAVEARIGQACRAAGRPRDAVRLVVVTKTQPADDVRRLAALGVREVGEAREPEASEKAAACAGLGLRWHFVGRLQSRKAASVAAWADVVHSVDRLRLVPRLGRAAREAGRTVECLVQVSLDGDPDRGGALPEDVPVIADALDDEKGLRLRGVMAVAPLGADPRAAFDRLVELADVVRAAHPAADLVSAGMSGDLEAAVAAGATHLRVGAAVLGPRPTRR